MSAPEGLAARRAALSLMLGAFREGLSFSDQEGRLVRLAPAERAAARRLAVETVRTLPRVDALLSRFVKKMPPEPARSALRLGAYEMAGDGAAAHGVVNGFVGALRTHPKGRHQSGLVNAVLRKVGEAAELPDVSPKIAGLLGEALLEDYGPERAAAMAAVCAARPPLDVSVKGDASQWAARLGGTLLPNGSVRLRPRGAVSDLPGFAQGAWWVQDAAAAIPALALGNVTGARVLDMCAAPGGKTMQLAARGADVLAVDVSEGRLKRLRENLDRTGLGAQVLAADLMQWTPKEAFDAILLDAPCSASGTLRRHPELPYIREGFDPSLLQVQADLLERASQWLKPGGRLVFATCSLLPEEGEAQFEGASQLGLRPVPFDVPGVPAAPDGYLRLSPEIWADEGGMDGFFIAKFEQAR